MLNDLNDTAFTIHFNAVEKGFWDQNTEENRILFYLKQIAMIHSEASETLEAIRKSKGDEQVVEELADIIIRVLDLYAGMSRDGYTNLSLQKVLVNKIDKNSKRERMHGVLG